MRCNTTQIFRRCHSVLFGVFLLPTLVLLSCGEEQGRWTAVQQEGAYIYGVWQGTPVKYVAQLMETISGNVKDASSPMKTVVQTDIAPETFLPKDGEVLDWVQSRAPSTYEGQKLYRDRPTAPELYHAYGFQRQAEAEYQTPRFGSRPLILVEVFDMGTPENAFGIYNFHVYPQAKFEWVGGGKAIISGGYLRFFKGKYFVEIEGYEFATGINEAMVLLAKAIAAEIKDVARAPEMVGLLPTENRINGTLKLFRNNWTLGKTYSGLPIQVPRLSGSMLGISARYQEGSEQKIWTDAQIAFILRFPDSATAASAYTVYRAAVMETAAPFDVKENGSIFVKESSTSK